MYMRAAFLMHAALNHTGQEKDNEVLRLKSVLGRIGALCTVCLLVGILCMAFPLRIQAAEENGISQTSSVKVYRSMSDSSDIIANLIVGNVFEVVGSESDNTGSVWYRVRTDFGVEGYAKARELDRLILEAQAMVPPVAAEYPSDNAAEDLDPEGDQTGAAAGSEGQEPEGENGVEEPAQNASDASGTDGNAAQVPEPGAENSDNMEQPSGEPVPVDNDADNAQDNDNEMPSESSTERVSEDRPESAAIDGAGFGKAVEAQTPDDEEADKEGFTVIENTDQAEIHKHGGIDAMLIMIIAGGIICIIAIAALARRMWTCIRTEM